MFKILSFRISIVLVGVLFAHVFLWNSTCLAATGTKRDALTHLIRADDALKKVTDVGFKMSVLSDIAYGYGKLGDTKTAKQILKSAKLLGKGKDVDRRHYLIIAANEMKLGWFSEAEDTIKQFESASFDKRHALLDLADELIKFDQIERAASVSSLAISSASDGIDSELSFLITSAEHVIEISRKLDKNEKTKASAFLLEEFLSHFKSALQNAEKDTKPFVSAMLANLLSEIGRKDQAISILDNVPAGKVRGLADHFLFLVFARAGQLKKAEQTLALIHEEKDKIDVLVQAAEDAIQKGQKPAGRKFLIQAATIAKRISNPKSRDQRLESLIKPIAVKLRDIKLAASLVANISDDHYKTESNSIIAIAMADNDNPDDAVLYANTNIKEDADRTESYVAIAAAYTRKKAFAKAAELYSLITGEYLRDKLLYDLVVTQYRAKFYNDALKNVELIKSPWRKAKTLAALGGIVQIEDSKTASNIQADLENNPVAGKDCYALATQKNLNFKAASKVCGKALRENPNDPQILYSMGILFESTKEYPAAYNFYKKAIDGGYKRALFKFALLHTYSEEYGLKPKKQRIDMLVQLGSDSNDETFKEAVRLYNLVLNNNPKHTGAMRMLAHHYNTRRGVPAAWAANNAKEWYRKAAALGDEVSKNALERWEAQDKRDAENYVDPNDGPCPFPEQVRNLYGTCSQP